MFEIVAAAFETPELAATNLLTMVSLYLALVTGADARVLVRAHKAAKRATVRVLTRTGRTIEVPATEASAPVPSPAATKLHKNASTHRY